MGLKKGGVTIFCEGCQYVAMDAQGGFEVSVPVATAGADIAGTAKLRCVVGPDCHEIELVEWSGHDGLPVETLEEVRQRIRGALNFVAERGICGNSHICPGEVIRIVKEQGDR